MPIVGDMVSPLVPLAVSVDPGPEVFQVLSYRRSSAGLPEALNVPPALVSGFEHGGKKQLAGMESLQDSDCRGDKVNDDPGVRPDLTLRDLVAVLVFGALEVEPGHEPQARGLVVGDAAAAQVEDLAYSGTGKVSHDDEASRAEQAREGGSFFVVNTVGPPWLPVQQSCHGRTEVDVLADRQT
jgi:hypothetical protein